MSDVQGMSPIETVDATSLPSGPSPLVPSLLNNQPSSARLPSPDATPEPPPTDPIPAPLTAPVPTDIQAATLLASAQPDDSPAPAPAPAVNPSHAVDPQPQLAAAMTPPAPLAEQAPADADMTDAHTLQAAPQDYEGESLVPETGSTQQDAVVNAPAQDITVSQPLAPASVDATQDAQSAESTSALESAAHATSAPETNTANFLPQSITPPGETTSEVPTADMPAPTAPLMSHDGLANGESKVAETGVDVSGPMTDVVGVGAQGTVRSRDATDDNTDEPSAKRAKVEDTVAHEADFKKPELPTPTQALPPLATTNGGQPHDAPTSPRFSTLPMTPVQKKILEEKVKNTKKTKHAAAFLRPVDIVALNIPSYPTIVTNPMDLGTLEQKLKSGSYASLNDLVNDFELIVSNCYRFNGEHHPVSANAQNLRAYFLKQMETVPTGESAATPMSSATPKSAVPAVVKTQPRRESRVSVSANAGETFPLREPGVPQIRRDSTATRPQRAVVPPAMRDLSYSIQPKKKTNQMGLKFCDHVLAELRKPRYSQFTGPFLVPVDPIALKIPHYGSIIKTPMDIQTITDKHQKGYYSTAEEFKADFDLIFANCFKFNPPGDFVNETGKKLQYEFNQLWKEKNKWIKAHQPQSQRESPVSEAESDEEESGTETAGDEKLRELKTQLASMQSLINDIEKKRSPKADSKKKRKSQSNGSKSAGGSSKSKKAKDSSSKSGSKSKSGKVRKITHAEAQEITDASEKMTEEQVEKITQIIFADGVKPTDDTVEIEDLPAETQQKLLRYVRTLMPRVHASIEDDDGYDGGQSRKTSGASKKKRKPMKADEQMKKLEEFKSKMNELRGGGQPSSAGPGNVSATAAEEQSSEDSEESSEEE